MSVYVLIVLCFLAVCYFISIFIAEEQGKAVFSFMVFIALVLAIVFQSINL